MRKLGALAFVALVCLMPACGGSSSPTAVPTPVPTPTPVPSLSGTYSGTMIENIAQQAQVTGTGRVTVTQNGNSLDFSPLSISIPGFAVQTYDMGNATLTGSTYAGGTQYNSNGCGVITVTNIGRFAGNLINMTATLEPAGTGSNCGKFEFRGELSR